LPQYVIVAEQEIVVTGRKTPEPRAAIRYLSWAVISGCGTKNSVMDFQTPTAMSASNSLEFKFTLNTPAPVSALAFGKGNHLVVGAGELFAISGT
jgi:hypothetical protein